MSDEVRRILEKCNTIKDFENLSKDDKKIGIAAGKE